MTENATEKLYLSNSDYIKIVASEEELTAELDINRLLSALFDIDSDFISYGTGAPNSETKGKIYIEY